VLSASSLVFKSVSFAKTAAMAVVFAVMASATALS
jgi:hypothetical protein